MSSQLMLPNFEIKLIWKHFSQNSIVARVVCIISVILSFWNLIFSKSSSHPIQSEKSQSSHNFTIIISIIILGIFKTLTFLAQISYCYFMRM